MKDTVKAFIDEALDKTLEKAPNRGPSLTNKLNHTVKPQAKNDREVLQVKTKGGDEH